MIWKILPKYAFFTLILTQKLVADIFRQIAEFFGRNGGGVSSGPGNSVFLSFYITAYFPFVYKQLWSLVVQLTRDHDGHATSYGKIVHAHWQIYPPGSGSTNWKQHNFQHQFLWVFNSLRESKSGEITSMTCPARS